MADQASFVTGHHRTNLEPLPEDDAGEPKLPEPMEQDRLVDPVLSHLRAAVDEQTVGEGERLRAGLWIEQAVRDGARNRLGVEHEVLLGSDALRQRRTLARSLRALFRSCLGATWRTPSPR